MAVHPWIEPSSHLGEPNQQLQPRLTPLVTISPVCPKPAGRGELLWEGMGESDKSFPKASHSFLIPTLCNFIIVWKRIYVISPARLLLSPEPSAENTHGPLPPRCPGAAPRLLIQIWKDCFWPFCLFRTTERDRYGISDQGAVWTTVSYWTTSSRLLMAFNDQGQG